MIRFLPNGALAPAPLKIDITEAAKTQAKLERLNPRPQGFEHAGRPLNSRVVGSSKLSRRNSACLGDELLADSAHG